jgi:hypothetical protein
LAELIEGLTSRRTEKDYVFADDSVALDTPVKAEFLSTAVVRSRV